MYRVEREKGLLLNQNHLGLDLDNMGTALQLNVKGRRRDEFD